MTDSQPYKDASGIVRVLPSVVYRGERLQIRGPVAQYLIVKNDWLSLNVNGAVQFSPYEEDDSFILAGLDEPDPTLLAGLDARITLKDLLGPRWALFFTGEGDVLGEYDGYQISAGASYSFGSPRGGPSGGLGAGVLWQDANWTNYFVGVPDDRATDFRSAYEGSSSLNPYISLRGMWVFDRNWSVIGLARIDFLNESWTDSPIVSDDTRTQTFIALNYTF